MSDNKGKIIVSAVLAIFAVGVLTLIIINGFFKRPPICALQTKQPQSDLSKLPNIQSSDSTALANFAGYLKYETAKPKAPEQKAPTSNLTDDEPTTQDQFMALVFSSISLTEKSPEGSQSLALVADCSTIKLELKSAGSSTPATLGYVVANIIVDLTVPNGNDVSCTIADPKISIEDKSKQHYTCSKSIPYPCKVANGTTIAQLVVDRIEFEVDRDPKKAKAGEFSTQGKECQIVV